MPGFTVCGVLGANVLQKASILRRIVYNGFSGNHLNSLTQSLSFTPAEEEAIWAVVDYNTMSNQLGEDVIINDLASDGTMLNSWVDLFGPIDYALLSNINTTNYE